MKSIALLKNQIQEYDWGSKTFIPDLLSSESPAKNPQAELWLGAHPKASSEVMMFGKWRSLAECIDQKPTEILGKRVAEHFNNKLPFLFKVLAAEKPLSIQSHPNKEQAEAGYERENRLKIPLLADIRNYKDNNHKPELICALNSFEGLKGFRKIEEIFSFARIVKSRTFDSIVVLLRKDPDQTGLKNFLSEILTLKEKERRELVEQIIQGAKKHRDENPCFKWILRLDQEYPRDIGVISPLFFNYFILKPGEALFIPVGELHAYLKGAALEIMANSDNVLRGGLTPKHVDVAELLKVIRFESNPISILTPTKESECEYFFPRVADEFQLSCIKLTDDRIYRKERIDSIEIIICVQGGAKIFDEKEDGIDLKKGVSVVVPVGIRKYMIQGKSILYKASVP